MKIRTVLALLAMVTMLSAATFAKDVKRKKETTGENKDTPKLSSPACGHPYRVISPFGITGIKWYKGRYTGTTNHKGVDIKDITANESFPVCAAAAGEVMMAEYHAGYGLTVIIKHDDRISTLYAHGSKILVTKGRKVRRGEQIMLAGSTGVSTGVHLHFEVRENGVAVDPKPYTDMLMAYNNGVSPLQMSSVHTYPNPWKPEYNAPLRFAADEVCGQGEIDVQIKIYDVRGKLVRNLSNKVPAPDAPGCGSYKKEKNSVTLAELAFNDIADNKGRKLASGVYLYKLSAEDTSNHTQSEHVGKLSILLNRPRADGKTSSKNKIQLFDPCDKSTTSWRLDSKMTIIVSDAFDAKINIAPPKTPDRKFILDIPGFSYNCPDAAKRQQK